MTTEIRPAFTPGPWKAVEALPGYDRDWTITADDRGVMIECYERSGKHYENLFTNEAAANARLIAAAPELYEVVAAMADSLQTWHEHPGIRPDDFTPCGPDCVDDLATIRLARAALAKADGR